MIGEHNDIASIIIMNTPNCNQYRLKKTLFSIFFCDIIAAEKPISEKTWVSPKINVKIATRPKSSFVKYLERIERRRIWTRPFVIVDIVVHPRPLIISFLLNLSDITHHKTVEE